MKIKNYFLFLFAFTFIVINPVHAYAGPGAAIGAIIVALTVILAFCASFLLGLFQFLKKSFKVLQLKFSKSNQKSVKNKKRQINSK